MPKLCCITGCPNFVYKKRRLCKQHYNEREQIRRAACRDTLKQQGLCLHCLKPAKLLSNGKIGTLCETCSDHKNEVEKNRESAKKYRIDHAEVIRNKARERRSNNLEKFRARDHANYLAWTPEKALLKSARNRARKEGLRFDLTEKDIHNKIPRDGKCPITGFILCRNKGKVGPNSMTLDRINPKLGYTFDNVEVISFLANTIKQDVSDPEIFLRLAEYLESFLGKKDAT